jgi:hypothetical protein
MTKIPFAPVRWTASTALALFLSAPALVRPLAAQPSLSPLFDYVTLDHPNSIVSFPLGINNKRQIAGFFVDFQGLTHGYVYKHGQFTTIDHPLTPMTPAGGAFTGGINDRGDLAGGYFDKDGFLHGFLMSRPDGCDPDDDSLPHCKPVFHEIDVPGAAQTTNIEFEFGAGLGTIAIGVNNHQDVVGMCAAGIWSDAFLLSGGRYTSIDEPQADHTTGNGAKIFGINDAGVQAGTYLTQAGPHGAAVQPRIHTRPRKICPDHGSRFRERRLRHTGQWHQP